MLQHTCGMVPNPASSDEVDASTANDVRQNQLRSLKPFGELIVDGTAWENPTMLCSLHRGILVATEITQTSKASPVIVLAYFSVPLGLLSTTHYLEFIGTSS